MMKRSRILARLRRDDAVSVVIGAILVAAILFAVLLYFRLSYVPVWEEQTEAAHAQLVERELVDLRAELDRHVDNRTSVPTSHPVTLGRIGFNPLLPDASAHQLSFTPESAWFNVSADNLLIIEENGTSYVGVNESWSAIAGNASLTDVSGIEHLRMRIASLSATESGGSLVLTVVDANGAWAGDLNLSVAAQAVGFDVRVRVRDATGEALHDQVVASSLQGTHAPWWLDALAPHLQLGKVLSQAPAPFDVHLEAHGLSAERAVTYRQDGETGAVLLGDGGATRTGWTTAHAGGTLQHVARNARYVDQDRHLENGALVLEQGDASVMVVAPHFSAERVGSVTSLTITLPTLTGDAASVAGASLLVLETQAGSSTRLRAAAPSISLSVQSAFPTLWAQTWDDELSDVPGLSAGTHYEVATTATHATLTVYGLASAPASSKNDLFLTFIQSDIALEVGT